MILSCKQEKKGKISSHKNAVKIDSIFLPKIGGINQAVKIKTNNSDKPVLLILCGGPGASSFKISDKFTDILKNKFTIVEWDQRNVGKTLELNESPINPTVELMSSDTYEVIKFITKELDKNKLHLLGSSWGNVLGFNIVKNHPELLHSYFAVNSVVNQLDSDKLLLQHLNEYYKDNAEAIRELKKIKIPLKKEEDLFNLWKWLFLKEGNKYVLTENYKNGFLKWAKEWKNVMDDVLTINLPKTLPKVDCPIYFFVGQTDFQTSTEIATKYFNDIVAPKKKLVIFEKSGHGIHNTEPIKFQNKIIELLKKDKLLE